MTTRLRNPRHTVVDWTAHHALGLDEIDAQHRLLFELANDLWHQLVRRSARNEVLATLTMLERSALSHFATEETFMRVTAYAQAAAHMAEHQAFVERVAQEKSRLAAGHPLSLDLLSFLKQWLNEHIQVADVDFARMAQQAHAQPAAGARTDSRRPFALSLWQRLLARF